MQTASITLALAGDSGNVVPKYGVTPSEVAVLRAIHADDAVTDVKVNETVKRSSKDEIARLREVYGSFKDANGTNVMNALFPGIAARAFDSFDELDIPDEFYAAETRATPDKEVDEPEDADDESDEPKDIDEMTKAELLAEAKRRGVDVDPASKKADVLAVLKGETEAGEVNDGVEDMPSGDSVLN